MYDPYDDEERLRFARYLARISAATRAIGVLTVIGAFIFLLVALGMNRSDDRVGFSLMAMTVALFGILVWGTGVFHGVVGRTIPTAIRIDRGLAALASANRAAEARALPAPSASPPAPAVGDAESSGGAPTPPPAPAPPTVDEPEAAALMAKAAPPEPEIEKTPCPHCGGLTHPQATRCVHCMKKIAR